MPASHGCRCLDDVIRLQGEHGPTELAGDASISQWQQGESIIEAMADAKRRFDLAMTVETDGQQQSWSISNGKAHR